ncbi:unnamed protein product [marine sediment metagenome]|uniref:Uncharacterized protein n=1 Tax=marine sediment metagenome TaxID=412755 RepID=X1R4W1_9ZZZZ
MPNWVIRIETAIKNSPSPEEIAREVEASGGKLSPVDLWLKKQAEELKNG